MNRYWIVRSHDGMYLGNCPLDQPEAWVWLDKRSNAHRYCTRDAAWNAWEEIRDNWERADGTPESPVVVRVTVR